MPLSFAPNSKPPAVDFCGYSDTEILVEGCAVWGRREHRPPVHRNVRGRRLGLRRAIAVARA
jgi:hypothetical protein